MNGKTPSPPERRRPVPQEAQKQPPIAPLTPEVREDFDQLIHELIPHSIQKKSTKSLFPTR